MNDTLNANALLDRVDAAMRLIEITRRERDEAITKLQRISISLEMWKDGNILHENHRDEIDKLKHELDIELERSNHYRDKWQTAMRERDEAKMKLKEEEYESGKYWAQLKITIDERDEALRERDEARWRIAQLLLEREEAIQQSMRDARRADANAALCSKLRDIAERAIEIIGTRIATERTKKQLRAELDQLTEGAK
jgi:hypothetical protein